MARIRGVPSQRKLIGKSGYTPATQGRSRIFGKTAPNPFEAPPAWWVARYPAGTIDEWACYLAHLELGLKPDQDFVYQYFIGALTITQDARVDFYEIDLNEVIEVYGIYWHYVFGGLAQRQKDLTRQEFVQGLGYGYVIIDEDCLVGPQADPVYYVRQARLGIDHSRLAHGGLTA